jgi:uncharacterized protein
MVSKAQIEEFLNQPAIAIAGVSSQKNKFGYQVYQHLTEQGKKLYALNPKAKSNEEIDFYKSLSDLPQEVKALYIVTRPEHSEAWVDQAIEKGYTHMWLQQQCYTPQALEKAKNASLHLVYNECMLLHTNPKGFHAFHRFLRNLFGKMPK